MGEKRPIVLKLKRTKYVDTNNDDDIDYGFIMTQFYVAERAMACAEYYSKGIGKQDIVIVFDFTNYNSEYAPSMNTIRLTGKVGQTIYVERMYKFIILQAPFWVSTLWM